MLIGLMETQTLSFPTEICFFSEPDTKLNGVSSMMPFANYGPVLYVGSCLAVRCVLRLLCMGMCNPDS